MGAATFVQSLRFPGARKTVNAIVAAQVIEGVLKQCEELRAANATLVTERDGAVAYQTRAAVACVDVLETTLALTTRAEKAEALAETYRARGLRLDSELDGLCRRHQDAIARAEKAEEDLRCFLRGEPSASSMISGLLSRVVAAEARAEKAEAAAREHMEMGATALVKGAAP